MSLEDDVRDLSRRVEQIERVLGISAAATPAVAAPTAEPAASSEPGVRIGNLPFLLGRALLGLAGAYLLRALTEAGTLPHAIGVPMGILYAIAWLTLAARAPAAERVETALDGLTAVLVLSPLLWEATLRFHAVSTWTSGAILVFFTVFGLAISWRKDILILATIATVAGVGTAAALLMATHDVLPFTLVILAIAAAVEASACLDHWLSERWLAASAANLSVLLATWLVTREEGMPANYAPIPHAWLLAVLVLLLAIYLSSTIIRTLLRGFTFTFFETAQCAFAVAITLNGCLRLSAEDARIAPAVGSLAVACAAACYLVSFVLLAHGRNFYTYSTFGILLAVAGTRILFPLDAASAVWLAMAVTGVWAGRRVGRSTLQVHGAIYLLLALVCLGTLQQAVSALMGTGALPWPAFVTAGVAVLCYVLAGYAAVRMVLAVTLALLLTSVVAFALTSGYHALFGADAPHSYCATLRTIVLALTALFAAWAGRQWGRIEISRLIYPLLLAGAWRLFTDDIHQERKAAAVLSLLVYGTALMMVSRRWKERSAPEVR
ncbi:MAG TPA: hypothetical protein VML19_19500 [Verrucomicrobiae bacterium]|nr:hypothetical protein [Verrucomicrobiae bacterium]